MRISTNPRLNEQALSAEDVLAIFGELRANALVAMVNPNRRHEERLLQQMRLAQVRGREKTDAVLASTDVGFRRFVGLRWVNPLD